MVKGSGMGGECVGVYIGEQGSFVIQFCVFF